MFRDLTNQHFSRLKARWPVGIRGKRIFWLASCTCGSLLVVKGNAMITGNTKSCGCLNRELQRAAKYAKHRHARQGNRTPEYRSWDSMLSRCNDPENEGYGKRGIKVCERWRNSFDNFLADMGPCPSGMTGSKRAYSLDRFPNPDGNYEPVNCRWATLLEQRLNRRKDAKRR